MVYQALIKDTRINKALDLVFSKEDLEKSLKNLISKGFKREDLLVWEMDAEDPSGS